MTLIRVVDFEATDFPEEGGRICAFGFVDVSSSYDPDGFARVGLDEDIGSSLDDAVRVRGRLCNPGVPIPSTASAIHHITDADVRDERPFDVQEIMWSFYPVTPDCDDPGDSRWFQPVSGEVVAIFAAHNAKAERGYLANHQALDVLSGARWVCTYKCAMRHWPEAPAHSNQALRYELYLDVPRALRSHGAGEDAFVTARILERLLQEVPLETLLEWSEQPALQPRCWIGKQRGMKWADVDSGFMSWCLDKDFDEDVIYTCRHWLELRERETHEGDVERERAERERDLFGAALDPRVLEQRGQQRLL